MAGVNEQVVDSVTSTNFKVVADGPGFYAGMAMANAVAHQNRLNLIAEAAVGNIVKGLTEVDPTEAVSVLKETTGNDVAQAISALAAALASNQQSVKAAQTTPPPTA